MLALQPTRSKTAVVVGLVLILAAAVWLIVGQSAIAGGRTWTSDADFDVGGLQGVNHDAPNSNQLQLNVSGSTFPIMWIANAGEDTVSKIDTQTGKELARYRTWFDVGIHGAWNGPAPSRTAVDSDGNVYVANRHFDGNQPDVIKILSTGGLDRNGSGSIETSADTDASGTISGSEILPLVDTNGNNKIDGGEIRDERIAWAAQVGGAGMLGRSLCIGTDGNIWLGTYSDAMYYKVSSADGSVLAGPVDISPDTPYGCLVDGNGTLWSASLGSYLGELNTSANTATVHNHGAFGGDYGIAIGNGKVYQGSYPYIEYDPTTGTFSSPAVTTFYALGVAVDGNGDIFAGPSSGGMCKFKPDGTAAWAGDGCVPAQPGTGHVRGVVVDGDNNVWAVHLNDNNISKFRGSDGAPLGVFPVGTSPYTYSDATGLAVLSNTTPTGFWTVTYDNGTAGSQWGTVIWNTEAPAGSNGGVPAGATLQVKVRTSDSQADLENQTYQAVSSGTAFSALGRFIQIQVKLVAAPDGTSPVLYDLAVQPVGEATPTPATPTAVAAVQQLPTTGGAGGDATDAAPWVLLGVGAAILAAGGLTLAVQRRRIR